MVHGMNINIWVTMFFRISRMQTAILLLKETMESVGFKPIRTEWWHYSYSKKMYTLSDMVWECNANE